ncbi:MAG: hypothetical protein LBF83_11710 [Spirochaetaceae bacterium]|nr:hypothetical protein [Spirochaetaceae bacterium]
MEFYGDYKKFMEQKLESDGRNDFVFGKLWPILGEKYSDSGSAKGDYFHHDLLAARRVFFVGCGGGKEVAAVRSRAYRTATRTSF